MPDIIIRDCRSEEIPEVTRINNLGKGEVEDWTTYSADEMRKFMELKDLLLVAEVDGEIAGIISGYYYTFAPPMKMKWGKNCVGIENLFVRKKFRDTGVGKSLVEEFCRRWKKRGCKYIEICVTEPGKLDYYKKLGFTELLYLPYRKL